MHTNKQLCSRDTVEKMAEFCGVSLSWVKLRWINMISVPTGRYVACGTPSFFLPPDPTNLRRSLVIYDRLGNHQLVGG